jgi:hypothetical protein
LRKDQFPNKRPDHGTAWRLKRIQRLIVQRSKVVGGFDTTHIGVSRLATVFFSARDRLGTPSVRLLHITLGHIYR